MKLLILSVADHAYIDNATRKLYILGAFNRIAATNEQRFPLILQTMTVVVKLSAEIEEIGNHKLAIALANEDGKELFRVEQPFAVNKALGGLASEINMILEIRDAVFQDLGEYQFRLDVDGQFLDSIAITVTEAILQE